MPPVRRRVQLTTPIRRAGCSGIDGRGEQIHRVIDVEPLAVQAHGRTGHERPAAGIIEQCQGLEGLRDVGEVARAAAVAGAPR